MWARTEGDRVAEITDINPVGRFHPSLLWVECGAGVTDGWAYADGEFSPPAAPAPNSALVQIQALEASVTPRRMREAVLGVDNGWLADVDAQIATLRAQL